MKFRQNLILIFISFILAGILLYFLFQKIGSQKIWEAFFSYPPKGIFLPLFLTLFIPISGVLRWMAVIEGIKEKSSFNETLSSWSAGFAVSYLTPVALLGGEAIRALILRKKSSLSWEKIALSIFIDKIIDGSLLVLFIFLGIFSFFLKTFTFSIKFISFLIFLSFLLFVFFLFYHRAFKGKKILTLVEKPVKKFLPQGSLPISSLEKDLFYFFSFKNKAMLKALFFGGLKMIFSWLRVFFLLYFLEIKTSLFLSFIIFAFTSASYLLPFPATLGSHEALQVFAFSNLGFSQESAVAFAFLFRGFDLLIAFLGIFFILRFGTSLIKIKKDEK